jgi:hypothetical protein
MIGSNGINQGAPTMKFATAALASALALSSTFALAHGYKHHNMRHSMNMMRGSAATSNPNGTASGPTTLSGTGPSTYGGNNPGARSSTRQ